MTESARARQEMCRADVESLEAEVLKRQVCELRSLYRSARRMSRIDDVDSLFNAIVDDIVSVTNLERLVIMKLDADEGMLEGCVYYGFDPLKCSLAMPFGSVNGLLKKVYAEREPLNVIDASKIRPSGRGGRVKCRIYRDDFKARNDSNKRQPVNCCLCGDIENVGKCYSGESFKHYSVYSCLEHDECVQSLIGDSEAFLIIPLCDDQDFFGYILADKGELGDVVTYREARIASAIAAHASLAISRAIKQDKMLQQIARHHRELQRVHQNLEDHLAEIEQVKNFYENIIQNLKSGLVTVDLELNFTHVNVSAEHMLGYSRDELLGRPFSTIFQKNDSKRCLFMDSADELDIEHGYLGEFEFVNSAGEVLPVQACLSAMTDRKGEITGLSCIFRDISERKFLEQHLSRMDKLASLGELAAGLAHEIKNPLAGITGAMQILARKQTEDAGSALGQDIFEEIFRQIKKLDGFVNNLLEFARPATPVFSAVNIESCLSSTLFLASTQIENNNITVELDYGTDPPPVNGDETMLQQLFLNLIINALDVMEPGGRLSVHICWKGKKPPCGNNNCISSYVKRRNDVLSVVIKDSGPGIRKEHIETIFNPFFTTKSTGTGLGLSIAHRVVEQHSGSIHVESAAGKGAVFTVCLPLYGSRSAYNERKACINCR